MRRALFAAALGLAACAPVRTLIAPADDYVAYRSTRVARTLEERLAAAERYVARFPEGEFAPEVRAFLTRAEPAFYASKQGSIAGLDAYLRSMPHGPHAQAAADKLMALRSVKAVHEEAGLAAAAEAQHARAAWQRARVRDVVARWMSVFFDPAAWTGPLSEAPAGVIVPWAVSLPPPVCAPIEPPSGTRARRCKKVVELPYTVPVSGVSEEREATLEIAIVEDASGRPLDITVGGPDLFLRLEEARAVRAVAGDDPEVRMEAITKALALVRAELEKRAPIPASCVREAEAPAVLALECGGLRLVVEAGRDGEDRVVVTRGR